MYAALCLFWGFLGWNPCRATHQWKIAPAKGTIQLRKVYQSVDKCKRRLQVCSAYGALGGCNQSSGYLAPSCVPKPGNGPPHYGWHPNQVVTKTLTKICNTNITPPWRKRIAKGAKFHKAARHGHRRHYSLHPLRQSNYFQLEPSRHFFCQQPTRNAWT